jgi:hypothetical protein
MVVGENRLPLKEENYRTAFGDNAGITFYYAVRRIMNQDYPVVEDGCVGKEACRMHLSVAIWQQFGTEWLKVFCCNKDSRNISPAQCKANSSVHDISFGDETFFDPFQIFQVQVSSMVQTFL